MTPTPRQQLVQIQAWSYSRFLDYEQCPFKAKLKIIDKRREPSSPALDKGNRVHAIADVFTTGKLPPVTGDNTHLIPELKTVIKGKAIPTELECFKEEFKVMQESKAETELEWAFDRTWNPISWFDHRAWLRMKVDAQYLTSEKKRGLTETTVHIVDHKTGKFNPEHALQRSLYALGGFLMFPDAKYVVAAHWYLDLGREEKETWVSSQLGSLKLEWTRRTTAMLADSTFAPKPGPYCRYCTFSKSKEGPCQF